jgi:hypothetical protein
MTIAYVTLTSATAAALFYAAYMNFSGHQTVLEVAERVRVSPRVMVPFGSLQLAGGVGLLVGFALPILGTAAAVGVVLFFICAIGAHIRVGDREIGPPSAFLAMAAATLVLGVAEHGLA